MAPAVLSAGTGQPIVRAHPARAITPREQRNRHSTRNPARASLADGMRIIAEFVRTLPRKPGVYRMIAADGEVLYVGKARSLRSRVAAYTQPTRLATRLMRMVSATHDHGVLGHRQRGRGAAAREQPDQALPAALQRAAARRQVVSLHRHPPRHRMAAARQASRHARGRQRVFRPLRLGHRGQPHALCAAARLPAAVLLRRRVRRRAPGPACSTRSSAARRPASAASTRPSTRRSSTRCAASWAGATARSSRRCRSAWNRPRPISNSSARPCCATASAR